MVISLYHSVGGWWGFALRHKLWSPLGFHQPHWISNTLSHSYFIYIPLFTSGKRSWMEKETVERELCVQLWCTHFSCKFNIFLSNICLRKKMRHCFLTDPYRISLKPVHTFLLFKPFVWQPSFHESNDWKSYQDSHFWSVLTKDTYCEPVLVWTLGFYILL